MNYLALCQSFVQQAAMSGLTSFTTVSGVTGQSARVTDWVNRSWLDIQSLRNDWGWMRSSNLNGGGVSFAPASSAYRATLGTGAGTVGVLAANFSRWVPESFRNYVTTAGTSSEIFMDPIDFDDWRDGYMYGAMRSVTTRPVVIAIAPDQTLCFGPPSNGLYTITGDYFVAPSSLSADTDSPTGLPAEFHMMIVYRALWKYGYYQAASEVVERAKAEYRDLYDTLAARYSPTIYTAGSLA